MVGVNADELKRELKSVRWGGRRPQSSVELGQERGSEALVRISFSPGSSSLPPVGPRCSQCFARHGFDCRWSDLRRAFRTRQLQEGRKSYHAVLKSRMLAVVSVADRTVDVSASKQSTTESIRAPAGCLFRRCPMDSTLHSEFMMVTNNRDHRVREIDRRKQVSADLRMPLILRTLRGQLPRLI